MPNLVLPGWGVALAGLMLQNGKDEISKTKLILKTNWRFIVMLIFLISFAGLGVVLRHPNPTKYRTYRVPNEGPLVLVLLMAILTKILNRIPILSLIHLG